MNFDWRPSGRVFAIYLEGVQSTTSSLGFPESDIPAFVNDHVVRSWQASRTGRPLFLKIAYNRAESVYELASYDPQLIVGILGGSGWHKRMTPQADL